MFGIKSDLYVKVLLTVIAISLAVLAGRAVMSTAVPSAWAVDTEEEEVETELDAIVVRKFDAPDVRQVYILGDDKTFVVQQKNMVSVVRVDYFEK